MLAILSYDRVVWQGQDSREVRRGRGPRRPARADFLAHVIELVLRQRDAGRVDAVVLGRVQKISPPQPQPMSSSAFTGGETQLAADVLELLFLRFVERVLVVAKIRARIHHALVEPETVERIRDVVVMLMLTLALRR